ncbi:hypothetical protein MAC_04481 [Metarhizium acridum CQMa 102]|uniref:N-acetyltransferase domain-containing protein n=1 Tax=Metarhizium acridum (strain CQMa 102) TaxID=655827 RepID=E9E3N7_METAQ|nr:uncharacterized protein MAC_04481 [Metarhizium acridum CQMa 102]EFY89462.1 hypothetical protein MAC_04481 [Metarhizium acridum CQMa 102]
MRQSTESQSPTAATTFSSVTIETTLPVHPYEPLENRKAIKTKRLLIRPLKLSDLEDLHALRSQPEVAAWSSKGKPNESIDITRLELEEGLSRDVYQFAICLSNGEMIGIGGSHRRQGNLGWPVIGYAIRHETWGNGYATEFLAAFLDRWWSLPREAVTIPVEKSTVRGNGPIKDERIVATTTNKNTASQKVMTKNGMELNRIWDEDDWSRPGQKVTMYGYIAKPHVEDA